VSALALKSRTKVLTTNLFIHQSWSGGLLGKGREVGKKADFLLGYRFEDHWEEAIEDVRKRLGLA
jgi:ubiquinone biosynthesis protein Coq4